MEIKTKITEMLGIRYPIIQGSMQWFATADLAAAVSNAGGLGIISSASFRTPEDLRSEIRRCKAMTDKPFAVNLSLFPSLNPVGYHGHIRVIAEEGVKIVETAGRVPDEYIGELKAAGIIVMHKCVAVKHALKAQAIGCDIVVIDAYESAGHIGDYNTTTIVLTPKAVDTLSIPVISAGGICDGRTLAAALMLGAEGGYMGTRFFMTRECPAAAAVKEELADSYNETDTYIALRPYKNTTRFVMNDIMKQVAVCEAAGEPFPTVAPLVAGVNTLRLAKDGGVLDDGSLCIGEDIGNIHDVPSVAELVDRIMQECVQSLSKFGR